MMESCSSSFFVLLLVVNSNNTIRPYLKSCFQAEAWCPPPVVQVGPRPVSLPPGGLWNGRGRGLLMSGSVMGPHCYVHEGCRSRCAEVRTRASQAAAQLGPAGQGLLYKLQTWPDVLRRKVGLWRYLIKSWITPTEIFKIHTDKVVFMRC